MNRHLTSTLGLVVLATLFVAVNILADSLLQSSRIDFTQGRLYTLTQGSKNIAQSLDEPITLDFFYSRKLATGNPAIKSYGKRVRELLAEYERISKGMIQLHEYDPEPFSELEDRAVQFRLVGTPINDTGERFYFGLIGTNSVGQRSAIPMFDPNDQQFLEYEITRLIYAMVNPKKKILGLVSTLEIGGALSQSDPTLRTPAWQIAHQIQSLFEVRRLDVKDGRVPTDLDVLMVIHPKDLPEPMVYAIDQYVLGGGRAVFFVDPHSESDSPPDPTDQVAVISYRTASNLPKLFKAWGVAMDVDVVAADLHNAQEAMHMVAQGRREPVPFIPWITLGPANINSEDLITGKLSRLTFANAGVIETLAGATTTVTRLAWTSAESMKLETLKSRFLPDPKRLTADFVSGDEELTLAVRITGDVKTAFPDGPPADSPQSPNPPLVESVSPINVIIVADTDLLADRFWVQQDAMGNIQKLADNTDLAINALDNLAGSSDLISVRARGTFARPFDRIDALRAKAEKQFRSEEQKLEQRLRDAQQRLTQIRQGSDASETVLSTEAQEELANVQQDILDTRRELRDVQFNLKHDVESLGVRLKIINTALIPLLVALGALALGAHRASRRRADRRAAAHT